MANGLIEGLINTQEMDFQDENHTLENFYKRLAKVLNDIYIGRNLLFDRDFRAHLENSEGEIRDWLVHFEMNIKNPEDTEEAIERQVRLRAVGLNEDGAQIRLKLSALFKSYNDYDNKGGIWRLKDFLDVAKMVLGSLADFIPGAEIFNELIEAIKWGIERAERNFS
jgi:hypothetical protein